MLHENLYSNLKNCKPLLVVLGCGESGLGAALLAKQKHYEVFVSDSGAISKEHIKILEQNTILWEQSQHTVAIITKAQRVIKSPGIPNHAPIIKKIKQKNIPIISDIEFAFGYHSAKYVGITGSNGKTTTTLLTYAILKNAHFSVGVAGNIGDSFAKKILNEPKAHYVLELSSFQLEGIEKFCPHIAILTNITPDHLERYEYDFQKYVRAKFLIVKNQRAKDYFIYDSDDPVIAENLKKHNIRSRCLGFSIKKKLEQGAFLQDEKMIVKYDKQEFAMDISQLKIKGRHNLKNAMAAGLAAKILQIKDAVIRSTFQEFQGVAHRLEHIGIFGKVTYINDSKATNINATYYALDSIKKNIIWIVGGVDKGNDYSELLFLVRQKVKAIICLGVENQKIISAYQNFIKEMVEVQNIQQAVVAATRLSQQGDTVLLSPACASFDIFKNYEQRGEAFKREVKKLYNKPN